MPLWYQTIRTAMLFCQSVVGVLIFFYTFKRRRFFALRFVGGMTVSCMLLYMLQTAVYIVGQTPLAVATHALVAMSVYAALICFVVLCFDETIWTVLFATSAGYFAQDIAGSFKQLLKQIPGIEIAAVDPYGIIGLDLICYGGMFFVLFMVFRPSTCKREEDFDNKLKAIFSLVAIVVCIGMARMTQDNPGRNKLAAISESIYSILTDGLILMVQFGIMERARLSRYGDMMRELVHQQRMQYEASKESIQLINEKYHDLKHLLRSFQGVVPSEQLRKLHQSIEYYDVQVNSGSEVLDVLVTQYMKLCVQQGIALTCSTNHADLSFVEELDLYALVHNALHNAINAVLALPPERERFISLTAERDGNMLTIHMENPCGEGIVFGEDGLPQTRGNPDEHGFGMRSMMRTAEKYDGTVAVKAEGGIFYLDILLLNPD